MERTLLASSLTGGLFLYTTKLDGRCGMAKTRVMAKGMSEAEVKAEKKRQKQLRARARRAHGTERETIQGLRVKPVGQWDIEELARGRLRDKNGNFSGAKPQWIDAGVHEAAMAEFKRRASADARSLVPLALDRIKELMTDQEVDERGRPVVPRGVQADLAKWAIEQLLGKPTQKQELEIGARLQAVLANSMVVPDRLNSGRADGVVAAMEVESWEPGEEGFDEAEAV